MKQFDTQYLLGLFFWSFESYVYGHSAYGSIFSFHILYSPLWPKEILNIFLNGKTPQSHVSCSLTMPSSTKGMKIWVNLVVRSKMGVVSGPKQIMNWIRVMKPREILAAVQVTQSYWLVMSPSALLDIMLSFWAVEWWIKAQTTLKKKKSIPSDSGQKLKTLACHHPREYIFTTSTPEGFIARKSKRIPLLVSHSRDTAAFIPAGTRNPF